MESHIVAFLSAEFTENLGSPSKKSCIILNLNFVTRYKAWLSSSANHGTLRFLSAGWHICSPCPQKPRKDPEKQTRCHLSIPGDSEPPFR